MTPVQKTQNMPKKTICMTPEDYFQKLEPEKHHYFARI